MKSHGKKRNRITSVATGRWTAYAAAAAATGFAATPTAEATIHYSGLVNKDVAGNHEVTFPLDPAGGSFQAIHNNFVAGSSSFSGGGSAVLYFRGAQSAAVNGSTCGRDNLRLKSKSA